MKRIIAMILLLGGFCNLYAQSPYPSAPPAAPNITRIEYFIDTDPGVGNATAFSITPQTNINSLSTSIDLTGPGYGYHRLFVRAKDADGRWAFWNNSFFSYIVVPVYPNAPAAAVNINKVEYFIDANPIPGTGVDVPITPGTTIANQSIVADISGLTKAAHTFYVMVRDENGRWSLTNFSLFSNASISNYPTAPAAATALQQMEYFIDDDPGLGNGTPVSFASSTDVSGLSVNVDLTGLADGTHNFFIRSRNNPWSHTNIVSFLKGAGLPVKWLFVQGEWKNDQALLQWATSFEEQTSHYEIEQSADGSIFKKIGTLKAAGNSTVRKDYKFTDISPVKGWNYYRIRQIDLDGKSSYSKVITLLNRKELSQPLLYPNPAHNQVYIELPTSKGYEKIQVFNSNGQLQYAGKISNGQTYMLLDISQYASGSYLVQLKGAKETHALRFVKSQ